MNFMIFRSLAYDTSTIPKFIPAGYSQDYFKDIGNHPIESITRKIEKEIVRWFFFRPELFLLLKEQLKIEENVQFRLEVVEPIISNRHKKPGDIDALLYQKNNPHKAIALECKRVIAYTKPNGKDEVLDIYKISDGIEQANGLQSIGFHQSYLAIFIEVDGRDRKDQNFLLRGISAEYFKCIYEIQYNKTIHKDVGIIFTEIVQPINKIIQKAGEINICVVKKAQLLIQSDNLTNRIVELMKKCGEF